MKTVDCVASGYEWICPECEHLNTIIEWTQTAICSECKTIVELNNPVHVTG